MNHLRLPQEVWMRIADFLLVENELQAFSETSYEWNQNCAAYLQGQLQRAIVSAAASKKQDSQWKSDNNRRLRRLDGISVLQRLARQDLPAATSLVKQFLSARNCTNELQHHTESSFAINTNLDLPSPNRLMVTARRRLRQQHATLRMLLRQQLSDGFLPAPSSTTTSEAPPPPCERRLYCTWMSLGCIKMTIRVSAATMVVTSTVLFLCGQHGNDNGESTNTTTPIIALLLLLLMVKASFQIHQNSQTKQWLMGARHNRAFPSSTHEQQQQQQQQDFNVKMSTKCLKKSRSVAGNLFAMSQHQPRCNEATNQTSHHRPTTSVGQTMTAAPLSHRSSCLHVSVSAPDLHQFWQCQEDKNDDRCTKNWVNALAQAKPTSIIASPSCSLWGAEDVDTDTPTLLTPDPLLLLHKPVRSAIIASVATTAKRNHVAPLDTCDFRGTRAPPRGCVGAYAETLARAKEQMTVYVKEQRKQAFRNRLETERTTLSAAFLDACTHDDSLTAVKIMSKSLPVEEFYIGSDGTESCALHTAAFHGATQTVDFLCRGISDVGGDDDDDGGLCSSTVNATDSNGWTALHFAAAGGNHCAPAVRILALQHGADLDVQAVNGYTPLQWALRLQNHSVATELRRLLNEAMVTKHQKRKQKFMQQLPTAPVSILVPLLLLVLPRIPNLVQRSFLLY